MRLLLDESLSHRLAEPLGVAGHDVIHVQALGLLGAPDAAVFRTAEAEHRVLISADTDFGDLLYQAASTGPSVVLLRRAPTEVTTQVNLLSAALDAVAEQLKSGAIAVVTPQRIRYRLLPVVGGQASPGERQ